LGIKRIRRRRHFLSWTQSHECIKVVTVTRPHANLKPPRITVEDAAAKIQRHRKVAIDYVKIIYFNRTSLLDASVGGVVELELQVILAVSRVVGI
jgi:hypothetical protein